MVAVKVTGWSTAADGSDETTVVVVAVLLTICTSAAEGLPLVKFVSPLV